MEDKINKYTRKLSGLPPGLFDVNLYCREIKLKLPFKSIVDEFKSGKMRLQMMLDHSKSRLKTRKKWKIRDTIISAKDNITFKEIIAHTHKHRHKG